MTGKNLLPAVITLFAILFCATAYPNTGTGEETLTETPYACQLSGTYSIGPSGNFISITKAIDSLKNSGIGGDINFELMPDYTSTNEIFPIRFPYKNLVPCFSNNPYKIVIRPQVNATSLEIRGAYESSLLNLDSVDYLTIDGRPGGIGSARELSIINNRAGVVQFWNASNNIIKYVNCSGWVESFPFASSSGLLEFSSTNAAGSDNNRIEYCDIFPGGDFYLSKKDNLIIDYSSNGTNDSNRILYSNIHRFNNFAINLSETAVGWQIEGNSFYDLFQQNTASQRAVINIDHNGNSAFHIIKGNYFGGTAPFCQGDQMVMNNYSLIYTLSNLYLTGNYIKRIDVFPGDLSFIQSGHSLNNFSADLIAEKNYFGGNNIEDSICIKTTSTGTPHPLIRLLCSTQAYTISVASENAFTNIKCRSIQDNIGVNLTVLKGFYNNINNTIGNPAIPNSIVNYTPGNFYGIDEGKAFGNTIANITNTSAYSNGNEIAGTIRGIFTKSDSVYNNKIFRLITNTPSANIGSIVGIWGIKEVNGITIAIKNEIHSLINKGTGGDVIGIFSNYGISADKNFIHSFVTENPGNTNGIIYGIYNPFYSFPGYPPVITNNSIRLGLDTAGNSITKAVRIFGVLGGGSIFHNTIAILGSAVQNGPSRHTYCCYTNTNPTSLNARLYNNIFYNSRSNASPTYTGRHYCLAVKTSDQSNYNFLFGQGSGAYTGSAGATSYITFAQWKAGTSKDGNSLFGDPFFIDRDGDYNNVDLHLSFQSPAEGAGTSAFTTLQDIDQQTRTAFSPVDIGADAANFNGRFSMYSVEITNKSGGSYSFNEPGAFLSDRAIAKRVKYNIPIDSTDLPIPTPYIDSIRLAGDVTILGISKWLNKIVISTTDDVALAKISGFPFVKTTSGISERTNIQGSNKFALGENYLSASSPDTIIYSELANIYNYGQSYGQVHIHQGEFLHNHGFNGQGMQLAMLDAGFPNYSTLPTFDSVRINNQFLGTWDFVNNNVNVNGFNSHGTQCLSTIAANNPGTFVGTAPKTSLYLFRTEDAQTEQPIEELNLAAALERADSLGVDIASISLGYTTFDDPHPDHTYADMNGNITVAARASDLAAQKGMLVVAANGNEGTSTWHFLSTPADADSILAVGAVNTAGTIGNFSSYGPSSDGQIKPGVAAVGVNAIVANPSTGVPIPGSGTSFACPNMAGLATCLWQAFPEENNMGIISALQQSASKATTPDDRVGYGIPDMKKAFVILLKRFYTQEIKQAGCSTLIKFKAKNSNAMNFEVQRKLPTDADYITINTISGSGSFASGNFNYSDNLGSFIAPISINYRIKMNIDTDTSFYFTPVTITHQNACATYTFTGNGNWTNPANWAGGIIPPAILPAGGSIVIDPIVTGECIVDISQQIAAGAVINVLPGKKMLVPGNLIIL